MYYSVQVWHTLLSINFTEPLVAENWNQTLTPLLQQKVKKVYNIILYMYIH